MGGPVTWVAILTLAVGAYSLVSHWRHGLPLFLPVATQALGTYSIIMCAALPPP